MLGSTPNQQQRAPWQGLVRTSRHDENRGASRNKGASWAGREGSTTGGWVHTQREATRRKADGVVAYCGVGALTTLGRRWRLTMYLFFFLGLYGPGLCLEHTPMTSTTNPSI